MSTKPQNLPFALPAPLFRVPYTLRGPTVLYICRESSTNPPFFCKTNPILIRAKINLTLYIKEIYGNFTRLRTMKNKPKTNPKQTQFVEPEMNVNTVITMNYEQITMNNANKNKPNQTQFQTQLSVVCRAIRNNIGYNKELTITEMTTN